jgi:hypothetical protein
LLTLFGGSLFKAFLAANHSPIVSGVNGELKLHTTNDVVVIAAFMNGQTVPPLHQKKGCDLSHTHNP